MAWSPGSIWDSIEKPPVHQITIDHCTDRMNAGEDPDKSPPIVGKTQPQMWYRDLPPWQPCKKYQIDGARSGHREVYNWVFRRWHWRVGLEELVSSVSDAATPQGNDPKYLSIRSNMLLASGDQDCFNPWVCIYGSTQEVAKLMVNTPGRTLFVKNTGHSIHFERPEFFARQIADFLPRYVDSSLYASQLYGVWDIWANGFASTLRITSVDDLGNVQGSVFDNLLTGYWDEESRTLTFLRIPNGAYPATFQVYVGHMFQNQDGGFNFSLAGSFVAFAGTGATAQRAEFGWVAKPQAIG